jgi:hypothetical protein
MILLTFFPGLIWPTGLTNRQHRGSWTTLERESNSVKNFFVSYNSKDKAWAEWVAWQLEKDGYTTVIQAWDFRS